MNLEWYLVPERMNQRSFESTRNSVRTVEFVSNCKSTRQEQIRRGCWWYGKKISSFVGFPFLRRNPRVHYRLAPNGWDSKSGCFLSSNETRQKNEADARGKVWCQFQRLRAWSWSLMLLASPTSDSIKLLLKIFNFLYSVLQEDIIFKKQYV